MNKNQDNYNGLPGATIKGKMTERDAIQVLMLSPFYSKSELSNRRTLVDRLIKDYNTPHNFINHFSI